MPSPWWIKSNTLPLNMLLVFFYSLLKIRYYLCPLPSFVLCLKGRTLFRRGNRFFTPFGHHFLLLPKNGICSWWKQFWTRLNLIGTLNWSIKDSRPKKRSSYLLTVLHFLVFFCNHYLSHLNYRLIIDNL